MSTVQVTKIDFESTSNNRISYASNTITIGAEGSNVITINSTAVSVSNLVPITIAGDEVSNGTIVANTLTVSGNGNIQVYGQINFNGMVTPTAINANTSAFAPGANNSIVRFSANTSNNTQLSLYGMVAGVNGQVVILSNIGTKNVIIENESPSEATAGNRFSLPQGIVLNGYQSISLIYDGTAARWKPTDYGSTSFYKSSLIKGFFAGGANYSSTPLGVFYATADRTTYSTETTAAVPGANLSTTKRFLSAAGNVCKGFFAGGSMPPTSTIYNTVDRTTYSTETTSSISPGTVISQARYGMGASGNSLKGFFSGGEAPAGVGLLTADRITYSSESISAVPGANLSQARAELAAAGNACKGFFSGGSTPTLVTTADRTTYSTETTAAVPGANLTGARGRLASAGNDNKGFFSGGSNSSITAITERTTYSSETTAAVPGANLSQIRLDPAGAGNLCKGFVSGGENTVPSVFVATADRINYTTETTAAVPGANLSQARSQLAGV